MCNYGYYYFNLCGHRGIEVLQYCNISFHFAGMTGSLFSCRTNEHYGGYQSNPTGKDPQLCRWTGMSGYCRWCEREFEMPKTLHYATHIDIPFETDGPSVGLPNQPVATTMRNVDYGVWTPASTGFSACNSSSRSPMSGVAEDSPTVPVVPTSPSPAAEPWVDCSPEWGDLFPYVYTPTIVKYVHELLGFTREVFTDYRDHHCYAKLNFPSIIRPYSSVPWNSAAYLDGSRWTPDKSAFWVRNEGLCPVDTKVVATAMCAGMPDEEIWRPEADRSTLKAEV
ncbi:hypothetical protein PVAG01_00910 [Phlyctema vagabunda]|uniref:C2H2-type domain-containing protein n=1 Tax=Phlyctema vagabunda TaxID=108571 RepID=A0ABR4PWZ2_9HELO